MRITERRSREEPWPWQDDRTGSECHQVGDARTAEEYQERRGIRCEEPAEQLKKAPNRGTAPDQIGPSIISRFAVPFGKCLTQSLTDQCCRVVLTTCDSSCCDKLNETTGKKTCASLMRSLARCLHITVAFVLVSSVKKKIF